MNIKLLIFIINTMLSATIQPKVEQKLHTQEYSMNVECVMQMPELPTGCEITSLCTVLSHISGNKVDKVNLADKYLPQGEIGKTSPYEAFVGNPHNSSDFGCFSSVIANSANEYLADNNLISKFKAKDITGATFDYLLENVRLNRPVIVWVTIDLAEPYKTTTWTVNGEDIDYISPQHCVVLTGYDKENNKVCVADPLRGNIEYDLDLFEKRFIQMGRQAVIIVKQ